MTDSICAKALLSEGGYTCVLCRGETTHTSTARGISPMLDFIKEGVDLQGFSAADKIVGKAAAMLFVLAGVVSVYGEVMSRDAAAFLEKHGVAVSYHTLTEQIINRQGTGTCPMEATVSGLETVEDAFVLLWAKREELRGK